jgi:hypothetical protein
MAKNKNQNQKTFNLNVKGYSLKIIRGTGDSNYNTFSHVFKDGEKSPLFGTSHNDSSTDNEVINWAESRLERYLSKSADANDYIEMLNQII